MGVNNFRGNRSVRINAIFIILGLFMMIIPFIAEIDSMGFGYAMAFVGLVVFLTTMILMPFFKMRANLIARIQRGEGILAWWRYDSNEWEQRMKKEISELFPMKAGGIALGVIFFLIGFVIFLADTDDNAAFFGMMIIIAIFFIVFTQLLALHSKKKLSVTVNEAVIHENGLFYIGQLTTWGKNNIKLKAVGFSSIEPNTLVFCYQEYRRGGSRDHATSIPIPFGEENTAIHIVSWHNKPITEHWAKYIHSTNEEEEEEEEEEA